MSANIAVCILFFNKAEQTNLSIASFARAGAPVFVLDNGSFPAAARKVAEVCNRLGNVRLISNELNAGCGPGRNRLIAETQEEWLLFVDNDITVREENWLENFQRHICTSGDVDVFVPKIVNIWDGSVVRPARMKIENGEAKFPDPGSDITNMFPGGGSLVNRSIFRRLGGYDPDLIGGFEDFEFALRAIRDGKELRVKVVDDVVLWHDHPVMKNADDRHAVMVRYNEKRVRQAHDKVEHKYGVSLDKNYREWLEEQISTMTVPRWRRRTRSAITQWWCNILGTLDRAYQLIMVFRREGWRGVFRPIGRRLPGRRVAGSVVTVFRREGWYGVLVRLGRRVRYAQWRDRAMKVLRRAGLGGVADIIRRDSGVRVSENEPTPAAAVQPSYSAWGEDRIALSWLSVQNIKLSEMRYLDIGAASPFALSNTFLFYSLGASGVLVEPDPDQANQLRKFRPRDTVLQAGVAFDDRRSALLTRFSSRVFNTFSQSQVNVIVESSKKWEAEQSIIDRIEVDLMPLNLIIERHLGGVAPHFLSIDAEGLDFDILSTLDLSRFRPWVMCFEVAKPLVEFEKLLKPHGYRFISRTQDNVMFMLLDPLSSGRDW